MISSMIWTKQSKQASSKGEELDHDSTQRLGHLFYGYRLYGVYSIAMRPQARRGCARAGQKKLLGTAYNGAPSGVPDCSEAGCMLVEEYELVDTASGEQVIKKQRCIRTIHAEQNLLLFTDREDREGSSVYVTDQPCWTCANMLANSGIVEIVYHRAYPKDSEKVSALMAQKGLTFRRMAEYEPPSGTLAEVKN